eukprot:3369740-Prymnesium_polylepis.1
MNITPGQPPQGPRRPCLCGWLESWYAGGRRYREGSGPPKPHAQTERRRRRAPAPPHAAAAGVVQP